MGCIWSSEPSDRCIVCDCKQSRNSRFINNKCTICYFAEQSRPSRTLQYPEYGSTFPKPNTSNVRGVLPQPRPNTSKVRGVLPQPRPNTISEEPQFGEYYCKPCGHSWKSLRSWSDKYQMCKRCKKPVYPHKLRELLSSDYKSTAEDPIEHPRELCQMCKNLGYACKNYRKNVYGRKNK